MQQLLGRAVIDQQRALGRCGARQHQGQTGIVKLSIPVLHAALEVVGTHRRQQPQSLVLAQKLSTPQAIFAGQRVVHLQARAIKRRVQQFVRRHHKSQRLRQVRRVVQQRGALMQRFAHQRDVALRQITHTTVHQLGGARGGALGKVMRLQHAHLEAAHGCIHRSAQTGGSTADNEQVVSFRLGQTGQQLGAVCGQRRSGNRHSASGQGKCLRVVNSWHSARQRRAMPCCQQASASTSIYCHSFCSFVIGFFRFPLF